MFTATTDQAIAFGPADNDSGFPSQLFLVHSDVLALQKSLFRTSLHCSNNLQLSSKTQEKPRSPAARSMPFRCLVSSLSAPSPNSLLWLLQTSSPSFFTLYLISFPSNALLSPFHLLDCTQLSEILSFLPNSAWPHAVPRKESSIALRRQSLHPLYIVDSISHPSSLLPQP